MSEIKKSPKMPLTGNKAKRSVVSSGDPAAKRSTGKASRPAAALASGQQKNRPVLQMKNDEDGFVPRREIPRTPPRVKSVQTPNKHKRSSPRLDAVRRSGLSHTPADSKNVNGGLIENSVTPSKPEEDCENVPPGWVSPSDRKVQALCFTPTRTLTRSPPRKDVEIPPPPKWEIPRTPVVVNPSSTVHAIDPHKSESSPNQLRLSHVQYGMAQQTNVAREKTGSPSLASPSLIPSQLLKSHSKGSSSSASATENGRLMESRKGCSLNRSHGSCQSNTESHLLEDAKTEQWATVSGIIPATENPVVVNVQSATGPHPPPSKSPPISIHRRSDVTVSLPEDLVCNDADLAFLQRMKNIRYHDQLQTQVVHLDKALRTTAEQKEQLQHKAEKVNNDLKKMKHKYQSTLRTLHLTFEPPASPNHTHPTSITSADVSDGDTCTLPTEMSHAHLSRLRHMQQLMTVQLEKTDREIHRKLANINRDKHELQEEIRKMTAPETGMFEKELKSIEAEKQEWQVKVQKASEQHHKMEQQLKSLHSQLSQLELTDTQDSRSKPHDLSEEDLATERRKAEERLRQLVSRCELYVKRHQLLKQLRQKDSI